MWRRDDDSEKVFDRLPSLGRSPSRSLPRSIRRGGRSFAAEKSSTFVIRERATP